MALNDSLTDILRNFDSYTEDLDKARDGYAELQTQITSGLQPLYGLLPNQLGYDRDGDGLPDGWRLPANAGVTSWEMVEAFQPLPKSNITPSALETEFYNAFNTYESGDYGYRLEGLHVWRVSWDMSQMDEGASLSNGKLALFSAWQMPRFSTMAMWLKEEVPGCFGDLEGGTRFHRIGDDGWGLFTTRTAADKIWNYPGQYADQHLRFQQDTFAPVGSALIVGPQVVSCYVPVEATGWNIIPSLNRQTLGDGYSYNLDGNSNRWDT
ncbi:hypothetical protein [Marivivens aquimaris]|uniref:hypothetical protein n=1 Tax=Marivivens aquimaris TaxID=2774876 RepID=UPI0018805144|nr:hypothetical protein [Marivivens aquimaris]